MTLSLPDSPRLSRRGVLSLATVASVPMLGLGVGAASAATSTVIRFTTTTANVRSGPSTSYGVVRTLRRATRLTGTLTSNGWLRIASGQYVGSAVLTADVVRTTRWTIGSTTVRSAPSTSGSYVTTYPAQTRVVGWYTPGQSWFHAGSGRYVTSGSLTATAPGVAGTSVISEASEYAGIYYCYGGSSPSTGFDCSGYTQYVHKQLGLSIPRTVADQRAASVPVSTRRVGHLVTFGTYHVAMYAGNGYIWDSSKPGYPIRKRLLWTSDVSYRAVPGVSY